MTFYTRLFWGIGLMLLGSVLQLRAQAMPDAQESPTETASDERLARLRQQALQQQDPLLYYTEARLQKRLRQLAELVPPLDPMTAGPGGWFAIPPKPEPRPFTVEHIQSVRRPYRIWFLSRFREADWTGAPLTQSSALDTMQTAEIRAMMQYAFGSPTSTVLDVPMERHRSDMEHVQFEYYFVVNDTIPLMVMDCCGPKGRGVIFAGDWADADVLPLIKEELIRRILEKPERMPFIDYYYDPEQQVWQKTGYDGKRYFIEQIRKPRSGTERPFMPDDPPPETGSPKGQ